LDGLNSTRSLFFCSPTKDKWAELSATIAWNFEGLSSNTINRGSSPTIFANCRALDKLISPTKVNLSMHTAICKSSRLTPAFFLNCILCRSSRLLDRADFKISPLTSFFSAILLQLLTNFFQQKRRTESQTVFACIHSRYFYY